MTSQRRILLCRWGFVLLCLLPTLIVGLWSATHASRGSLPKLAIAELEQQLSNHCGLAVEIDRGTPSGSALRLEGVRLLDPETREIVAQAAAVDAIHIDGIWRVEAYQPVLNLTHLSRLLPRLHDRMLCGSVGDIPAAILAANGLVAIGQAGQQSFGKGTICWHLPRSDSDVSVEVFAARAAPFADPLMLTVTRQRSSNPPATHWQVSTGGQPWPLAALVDIAPALARLGADCHFAGSIAAGERDGHSEVTIEGTLASVDFDTLVTEHFPHQLHGRGTIRIEGADVRDGRLAEFRGGIDIASGSVSQSLISAAQEHLGLTPGDGLAVNEFVTIPFQRLAMDLALDGRKLRIHGQAGQPDDHVVLLGTDGSLLESTPDHTTSAVDLLRTLLPENQFQVPATRQTDSLVALFPVPDLVPIRVATRPAHVPTRLRDSGPADAAPTLRQPGLR